MKLRTEVGFVGRKKVDRWMDASYHVVNWQSTLTINQYTMGIHYCSNLVTISRSPCHGSLIKT